MHSIPAQQIEKQREHKQQMAEFFRKGGKVDKLPIPDYEPHREARQGSISNNGRPSILDRAM